VKEEECSTKVEPPTYFSHLSPFPFDVQVPQEMLKFIDLWRISHQALTDSAATASIFQAIEVDLRAVLCEIFLKFTHKGAWQYEALAIS